MCECIKSSAFFFDRVLQKAPTTEHYIPVIFYFYKVCYNKVSFGFSCQSRSDNAIFGFGTSPPLCPFTHAQQYQGFVGTQLRLPDKFPGGVLVGNYKNGLPRNCSSHSHVHNAGTDCMCEWDLRETELT